MSGIDLGVDPNSGASDVFRSTSDVLQKLRKRAEDLLNASIPEQLVLSSLAGAFICFGAMVAVTLSEGSTSPGPQKLYMALGFMCGFVALFISTACAFTEVNVVLPLLMLKNFNKSVLLKQLRFWLMVWLGNLLGALVCSTLFNLANVMTPPQAQNLKQIILYKLRFRDGGAAGWFQVVLSGALCNWMVGMASFGSAKAKIIASVVLAVFFPVLAFVALSLEQTLANMGLFTLWLTYAGIRSVPSPDISWGDAFLWSIFPSSIGNTLGAFVMCSMLFAYVFDKIPCRCICASCLRKCKQKRKLKKIHESTDVSTPWMVEDHHENIAARRNNVSAVDFAKEGFSESTRVIDL